VEWGSEKDCIKVTKMKKVRIHREGPFDSLRRRDKNIGRIISLERHDTESMNILNNILQGGGALREPKFSF